MRLTERKVTPMFALFTMQLAILRFREQCLLNMSRALLKVKDSILMAAARYIPSEEDAEQVMNLIAKLTDKVCSITDHLQTYTHSIYYMSVLIHRVM
jgi:hypothetical protein